MDGARCQDHLTGYLDGSRHLATDELYPAGAITIEEDSRRVGVQQQREVRTCQVWPQEGARRAGPRAVGADVHVDVAGPRPHGTVHVVDNRKVHLPGRFKEGRRCWMWIAWRADVDGSAGAAPVVGAAFPVLLGFERGQDVLERPTCGALAFPTVVIALGTARPNHRVDGAAATENTAERHVEAAAV